MPYEIDFLRAGDSNGDAICLRYWTGSRYAIHIIDGGFVDTGDMIVEHVSRYYGQPDYIDNMIVSHADSDHTGGLIRVLEHFHVGHLWINRPWMHASEVIDNFHGNFTLVGLMLDIMGRHQYLVDLERFAEKRGTRIHYAFQGTHIGPFTVLSPSRTSYLELIPDFGRTPRSYAGNALAFASPFSFAVEAAKSEMRYSENWAIELLSNAPDPTTASNESCVVQAGYIDNDLILLTADAGPDALHAARDYFESQWPNLTNTPLALVQVPHHGSRRNSTPSALNRWLGRPQLFGSNTVGTAICSVGAKQDKYPRRRVSNAFLRRGYPVFSTHNGTVQHQRGTPDRGWGNVNPVSFAWEFVE